ncbi:hypothetical protein NSQ43_15765 [Sporosarcina sp. FSL W8-0480]|uniref:hypothetical protein n=1 Tax=Sporosarcina sp. FSL W8-0480 TaxID=2954701 RepID=UPI0030D80D76
MDKELMDFLTMMNSNMEKGFKEVKKQFLEVNRKLDVIEGRVTRGFDETATLFESADKRFITLAQSDIKYLKHKIAQLDEAVFLLQPEQ